MTFQELLDAVYERTRRPDLSAETTSAVRAATLKAHGSDYYARDLHEEKLHFETASNKQSLDIYSLFCNFRSLKCIERYDAADPDGEDASVPFNVVTIDELRDAYGRKTVDTAYVAGRNLNMRAATDFQDVLFAGYMYPIVTPVEDYSSWVAQLQPDAIIVEACRVIFKMIGYDEQASAYKTLIAEEYQILQMTGIPNAGY